MDDLISRQAAIDAISLFFDKAYIEDADVHKNDALYELNLVPSADLSEYSDKLWKTAYERGKEEAHPRKGKWVLMSDCTGKYYACSWCGHEGYSGMNYCPNCGARMEE